MDRIHKEWRPCGSKETDAFRVLGVIRGLNSWIFGWGRLAMSGVVK